MSLPNPFLRFAPKPSGRINEKIRKILVRNPTLTIDQARAKILQERYEKLEKEVQNIIKRKGRKKNFKKKNT